MWNSIHLRFVFKDKTKPISLNQFHGNGQSQEKTSQQILRFLRTLTCHMLLARFLCSLRLFIIYLSLSPFSFIGKVCGVRSNEIISLKLSQCMNVCLFRTPQWPHPLLNATPFLDRTVAKRTYLTPKLFIVIGFFPCLSLSLFV